MIITYWLALTLLCSLIPSSLQLRSKNHQDILRSELHLGISNQTNATSVSIDNSTSTNSTQSVNNSTMKSNITLPTSNLTQANSTTPAINVTTPSISITSFSQQNSTTAVSNFSTNVAKYLPGPQPTRVLPNPQKDLTAAGQQCLNKCKLLQGISCKKWTDDSITCCQFTGCQWPFYCRPEMRIMIEGCVNKP